MEKPLIYHYTSIETLYKIIKGENDEICIRATHAGFMNDPKEYDYAISILEESMREYEELNRISPRKSKDVFGGGGLFRSLSKFGGEPFILSFSEYADDLSMWRAYGKDGNGVNIGFKKEKLIEYARKKTTENTDLIECKYDKNEVIKALLDYWKKEYKNITVIPKENGQIKLGLNDFGLLFSINKLAFQAKCSPYKLENEWRLCSNRMKGFSFRASGNVLVPYIEHYLPKDSIKEIVIGPSSNSIQVENGLKMFLREHNYSIISSDISYRQV